MESPVIPAEKPETITFYDALKQVYLGKRVTRISWGSEEEYVFLHEDNLYIHTRGKDHIFQVRGADLEGEDYYVIKQDN